MGLPERDDLEGNMRWIAGLSRSTLVDRLEGETGLYGDWSRLSTDQLKHLLFQLRTDAYTEGPEELPWITMTPEDYYIQGRNIGSYYRRNPSELLPYDRMVSEQYGPGFNLEAPVPSEYEAEAEIERYSRRGRQF